MLAILWKSKHDIQKIRNFKIIYRKKIYASIKMQIQRLLKSPLTILLYQLQLEGWASIDFWFYCVNPLFMEFHMAPIWRVINYLWSWKVSLSDPLAFGLGWLRCPPPFPLPSIFSKIIRHCINDISAVNPLGFDYSIVIAYAIVNLKLQRVGGWGLGVRVWI